MQIIDIHTHKSKADENVISIFSQALYADEIESKFKSVGLHPWHLDKMGLEEVISKLFERAKESDVIAIGEIGLDRAIATPFDLQEKYFKAQLGIAEHLNKAVIIHNVKASSDLLNIRKSENYKMPWIIHGFNEKKDSANQLIRMGCYLSFGHHLLDESSKAFGTISSIPIKSIFLETDESEHNIEDIYKAAAKARNMDIEKLSEKILENYNTIFGK